MANTSPTGSSDASWASPGAGITGGYDGNSLTLKVFVAFFAGLAMYNALELIIIIFLTFNRYRGLYFWSLLCASLGIVPYALGFLLKFFDITQGNTKWLAIFFLSIGWYPMITGQSLVLWSRLHLVVSGEKGEKIIRWTKWMIIVDAIILHIPTTVLTFGSNSDTDTVTFERAYNIMEKIQMVGFFLQEIILSSIYIVETIRILKTSLQPHTRKTMRQLVAINIVIIIMDVGLLGVEGASLYILETLLKGVIYSIKLKLEFAILSKLVKFVTGNNPGRLKSISLAETFGQGQNGEKECRKESKHDSSDNKVELDQDEGLDVSDFVDLNKVQTDMSHASPTARSRKKSSHCNVSDEDYDLARFEHIEDISTIDAPSGADGSIHREPGEGDV